jgi:hypothetical protein
VQPLAMHEVNLASGNSWQFGEQETGLARRDDPCSAWKMMREKQLTQPEQSHSAVTAGAGGTRCCLQFVFI